MRKGFVFFLLLTPILFALDQVVKLWARTAANGQEGKSLGTIWPGVFEMKLVYNEGVAFGMFQGKGLWLTPIAIGIAAAAAWYSWKNPTPKLLPHITAALLASGAVGNLVDRLVHQKVTDMFWIRAINFPVFNIADVCITIAGFLLVFGAVGDLTGHKTPATAESTAPTQSENV